MRLKFSRVTMAAFAFGVLAVSTIGQASAAPAENPETTATTHVDAALEATPFGADQVWLFKDSRYVRYNVVTDTVVVGPRTIAEGWTGLPARFTSGIDAAVPSTLGPNQAWLFKDDQYVRYDLANDQVIVGPRTIAEGWTGLPARFTRGIDAAVTATPFGADQVWLFKDDEYVRYNTRTDTVVVAPRKISQGWVDMPAQFDYAIDAAVTAPSFGTDQAWLFNDADYVRYDTKADKTIAGPRDTAQGWPGLRWTS
ncbi:hypothetical protein BLA60_41260 [Actinophytocola xinjiangensis]|uniref:Hemopexin n=1 Tax=Actinophytocola xinjiangensis TaxID=485602 RepID=A0A7Z0WD80_9PSEU|nr:hemopexin repeat-containing protein [Actinophytocola xinjiangensis]OLF04356.1 hypothetical protein BLA60_41260 [Actinophytocola xinjiangensis]